MPCQIYSDALADSRLVDETSLPDPFLAVTRDCRKHFMKSPTGDIVSMEDFTSPIAWGVYWALARAGKATQEAAKRPLREDEISEQFLRTLEGVINSHIGSEFTSYAVGSVPFFKVVEPAKREEHTGADILLLVTGKGLVAAEGIRMLWIQAKKSNGTTVPYKINYHQLNSHGLQLDVLRKNHNPKEGSFAFYVAYTPALNFVPCISVTSLPNPTPKTIPESHCELGTQGGARLQELLLSRITTVERGVGSFKSCEELIKFITSTSGPNPLYISIICSDLGDLALVDKVKTHYDQILGLTTDCKDKYKPPKLF